MAGIMTERVCDACRNRNLRNNRMLCEQCAWELKQALRQLPELLTELDISLTRQSSRRSRNTDGAGATRHEMVAYDMYLAELRDEAVGIVHQWVVQLGGGNFATWPALEWFQPMCRLLAGFIDIMVNRDDFPRLHRQVTDIARRINRAIDLPPDRLYAGKCGTITIPPPGARPGDGTARGASGHWVCDRALYAEPRSATVTCPECGARHEVAHRRDAMLDQINDRLVTAAEAAGLIAYLGDLGVRRERVRKLVNQWHTRGRLVAHSATAAGPLFVFGEILGLLARWQVDGRDAAPARRRRRRRRRRPRSTGEVGS